MAIYRIETEITNRNNEQFTAWIHIYRTQPYIGGERKSSACFYIKSRKYIWMLEDDISDQIFSIEKMINFADHKAQIEKLEAVTIYEDDEEYEGDINAYG